MEETGTMEALQEGTIPNAEGTNEAAEVNDDAAAPQAAELDTEQSEQSVNNQDEQENGSGSEDYLSVTVNHEERTLNRDEAIRYAQLGLQKEYLDPFIAKIDYLAAVQGLTREEYIEGQLKQQEDTMRQSIIDKFGNDENTIKEMMDFKKQKHKEAYENMLARQKEEEKNTKEAAETRLAGEFAELVKEFPELEGKSFKDLPAEVKKAGFGGEKLLSAYLYHKHSEGKKIAEATAAAEEAAKKSAGSMQGTDTDGKTEAERQYLNGLWGR